VYSGEKQGWQYLKEIEENSKTIWEIISYQINDIIVFYYKIDFILFL
jgi:hypothetical protein